MEPVSVEPDGYRGADKISSHPERTESGTAGRPRMEPARVVPDGCRGAAEIRDRRRQLSAMGPGRPGKWCKQWNGAGDRDLSGR